MVQLVTSMSGVMVGGVVEVVGPNPFRGKSFTASIGSVDSLYPSIYRNQKVSLCWYIYKKKRMKKSF